MFLLLSTTIFSCLEKCASSAIVALLVVKVICFTRVFVVDLKVYSTKILN